MPSAFDGYLPRDWEEKEVERKADKWGCYNWPEILREAKARLEEARRIGKNIEEEDTLEYWCAWCAHANAAAVFRC